LIGRAVTVILGSCCDFRSASCQASPHQTDIAIIGAGPVGLFAVFECGMLKMRSAVIDALDMHGRQCAALYPEKPIYDIPGYPRIDAMELIERLSEQAAPFHPAYYLGQQVDAVEQAGRDGGSPPRREPRSRHAASL
jgi:thioredoxin reductase (NADPH)